MHQYFRLVIAICGSCILASALAQSQAQTQTQASGPGSSLVTVNGTKILTSQLNDFVSMAVANGAKDTPQLRQSILSDLIFAEALSQDVKKTGLLNKNHNALKLKVAQQNALFDLWLTAYLSTHPVTEADVRSEYDRRVALSKEPRNSRQYQVFQILVGSEADGDALIREINAGATFASIAREKSLDKNSSAEGGLVGWLLPDQLIPPINDVVVNLSKGVVATRPIRTANGWHIVKFDDVRPFVMPTFEQAQAEINRALLQQRRSDAMSALMKDVKIVRTN